MRIQMWATVLLIANAPGWAQSSGARQFYTPSSDGSGQTMDYAVQPGETLFHIAERFLGDPYRAESLAKENAISDPLRPRAGTSQL